MEVSVLNPWRHGAMVSTSPFQGGNTGSTPVGATSSYPSSMTDEPADATPDEIANEGLTALRGRSIVPAEQHPVIPLGFKLLSSLDRVPACGARASGDSLTKQR